MIRRALLLVLLVVATPATARNAVKLTGPQIETLLSGNTAIGEWEGTAYRQYFREDGVTLYAQDGKRTARGDWRVDPEAQEYQSRWPGDAGWEGWLVMEWGDSHYWVSRTTPPTPFEIEEGERLVADTEGFCRILENARETDTEALTVPDLGGGTCTRSLGLGGIRALTCRWPFAYRAANAQAAFETLSEDIVGCGATAETSPSGVNHPDSYDQRQFSLDDGTGVAVSLKDKAALRETYLFLRIETRAR